MCRRNTAPESGGKLHGQNADMSESAPLPVSDAGEQRASPLEAPADKHLAEAGRVEAAALLIRFWRTARNKNRKSSSVRRGSYPSPHFRAVTPSEGDGFAAARQCAAPAFLFPTWGIPIDPAPPSPALPMGNDR